MLIRQSRPSWKNAQAKGNSKSFKAVSDQANRYSSDDTWKFCNPHHCAARRVGCGSTSIRVQKIWPMLRTGLRRNFEKVLKGKTQLSTFGLWRPNAASLPA